eukprot:SAG11_NODE_14911_length_601_cov_1.163306_1_plen_180_part_00
MGMRSLLPVNYIHRFDLRPRSTAGGLPPLLAFFFLVIRTAKSVNVLLTQRVCFTARLGLNKFKRGRERSGMRILLPRRTSPPPPPPLSNTASVATLHLITRLRATQPIVERRGGRAIRVGSVSKICLQNLFNITDFNRRGKTWAGRAAAQGDVFHIVARLLYGWRQLANLRPADHSKSW